MSEEDEDELKAMNQCIDCLLYHMNICDGDDEPDRSKIRDCPDFVLIPSDYDGHMEVK